MPILVAVLVTSSTQHTFETVTDWQPDKLPFQIQAEGASESPGKPFAVTA